MKGRTLPLAAFAGGLLGRPPGGGGGGGGGPMTRLASIGQRFKADKSTDLLLLLASEVAAEAGVVEEAW